MMKKNVLIICLLLIAFQLKAQVYKKKLKVVSIIENQVLLLHSGTHIPSTYSNGTPHSRETIQVSLPKNTVEWYYVFGATPVKSNTLMIDLASQLTRIDYRL